MDQSMVAAKTFVLKTNIHCSGCEKKIKKLLQDIGGVHRISIDAAQGEIKISGTIDPQTLLKLLQKNGKKSELVWEPLIDQKDLKIMRRPKSPVNKYHGIHDEDVVSRLQKLSEIKGLKSVELTRDGVKITFKEDYENGQGFSGKSEACSARKSPGKAMHERYDGEESCCSRNEARYKQYCDGCGRPKNCGCMASHGNISQGIPWRGPPGYFPSAPPEVPVYYPPPAPPPPQDLAYSHPFYSTFSDDNPRSCNIM
ncbi:hypothetical protein DCAR_0313200 [Daucus carota subsp. sativus]|uniref:Uncharacterized protein n=1 Tax=Daucus carota subsp. sativus TaxID=79200 RepID=A0A166BVM3_DAUCS|nr:PREDICTED: heavy metal-associated isoprenylated plant protein 3-like [Daucus carota subsp. sativus]WOG93912.1 hypothetical protein DCAR_0313200 [Daucus carota subsp. sativus]